MNRFITILSLLLISSTTFAEIKEVTVKAVEKTISEGGVAYYKSDDEKPFADQKAKASAYGNLRDRCNGISGILSNASVTYNESLCLNNACTIQARGTCLQVEGYSQSNN